MEWKFRGYDAVGNKGWVYGDLVHNKRIDLTDRIMVGGYEVVPESVGIFTGLNDMYGKPIYEGDIVYVTFVDNLREVCSEAVVVYDYNGFYLYAFNKVLPLTRSVEVIGTNYEEEKQKEKDETRSR